MADLISISPPGQLSNASLIGARAFFFDAGTTTPRTVYADQAETVAHPSPLVANGGGLWPAVFVSGSAVKAVVQDAVGAALYTLDPCVKVAATGAAASAVTFAPSISIPATNVQQAIEQVASLSTTAVTITNLNTLSSGGTYYAASGATGAPTTGDLVVTHYPADTTARAWQLATMLSGTNASTIYRRVETASTWGAWKAVTLSGDITVADLAAATIATQAEAEAGAAANRLMTPERTEQHMLANALGWGQTWQNPSRTHSTSYQNTTGRPIQVSLRASEPSGPRAVQVSVNGSAWIDLGAFQSAAEQTHFVVPNNWFYRINANCTITFWAELR